jgi:hypothetical protein
MMIDSKEASINVVLLLLVLKVGPELQSPPEQKHTSKSSPVRGWVWQPFWMISPV